MKYQDERANGAVRRTKQRRHLAVLAGSLAGSSAGSLLAVRPAADSRAIESIMFGGAFDNAAWRQASLSPQRKARDAQRRDSNAAAETSAPHFREQQTIQAKILKVRKILNEYIV